MNSWTHQQRKSEAFDAVDRLHCDQTVPMETTLDSLQELREHLDTLIDAVQQSIKTRGDE